MKILFVPDVKDWAIGHLVQAKVKYLQQFDCEVFAVHPRDAVGMADEFFEYVEKFNPDVIIYEYFRSAEQLINARPELKQYKSILVHHNHKRRMSKDISINVTFIKKEQWDKDVELAPIGSKIDFSFDFPNRSRYIDVKGVVAFQYHR